MEDGMREEQPFRGARGGMGREDTEEAMDDRWHRFTGGLERVTGDGGEFYEPDNRCGGVHFLSF